jgi:hypothetical protein
VAAASRRATPDGTPALSGWVWVQRPRRWVEFSILSRGLPKIEAISLEDDLVSIIAKHT